MQAPSLIPEAFPAVTVPSFLNAGLSAASFSGLSPCLGNSSVAKDAWQIVRMLQEKAKAENVREMQEAVGNGMVITELSEIYRAAKEGRGDLLLVNDDFHQAVRVTDEFALDLVTDVTLPGVIDDISSEIAWEVISKKGRAIFTTLDELKIFGDIALKVRY